MNSKFIDKTLREATRYIQQSIFSEKYAGKDALLQRMDPRIKLITSLGFVLTAILVQRIEIFIILMSIASVLAVSSRIPLFFYLGRVWIFIPIFTGIVAIPAIFNVVVPGKELVRIFSMGNCTLSITEEGVYAATILILRVTSAISFTILLILTTKWSDVTDSMYDLRFPKFFVLILLMAYRYIFTLLDFVSKMLLSRKSRVAGKVKTRSSWRLYAPIVGALFMKSYSLNEKIYLAMIARGFNGEIKTIKKTKLNPNNLFFLLISFMTYATLIVVDYTL